MEKVRGDSVDVLEVEERIREKMMELQRTSIALTDLQKSHSIIREELYICESELATERRSANELRARLKTTNHIVNELTDSRLKEKSRNATLLTENKILKRECDSLRIEARNSKVEAAQFRRRFEETSRTFESERKRAKSLDNSMEELKKEGERIVKVVDSNLTKLSQEQKRLATTCCSLISLNNRLSVFGLCQHANNQRKEREIEKLRDKIVTLEAMNVPWTRKDQLDGGVEAIRVKLQEALKDLRSKLENGTEETDLSFQNETNQNDNNI